MKHFSTASLLTLPQTLKLPQHNLKRHKMAITYKKLKSVKSPLPTEPKRWGLNRGKCCCAEKMEPLRRFSATPLLLLLFLLCIPSSLLLGGFCLLNKRTQTK